MSSIRAEVRQFVMTYSDYAWTGRAIARLVSFAQFPTVTFYQLLLLILNGFDQRYQASINFYLTSAIDKSQQHHDQELKSWERRESNPRQLGEKSESYLFAMPPPPTFSFV